MELEDVRGTSSHPFESERKGQPPFSGEINCGDLTCSEPESSTTNIKTKAIYSMFLIRHTRGLYFAIPGD